MHNSENTHIDRAIYDTVHATAGGAKVVADRMQMRHQVLINKVGLNTPDHHLNIAELVRLMRVTQDTRILDALAGEFGGQFVPVPVSDAGGDPNLVRDLARISAEFGELMGEIAKDLSDGVLSDNELRRVEQEAHELRTALTTLMRDLRRLNQKSHPPMSAHSAATVE